MPGSGIFTTPLVNIGVWKVQGMGDISTDTVVVGMVLGTWEHMVQSSKDKMALGIWEDMALGT